jgi:flagellar hook-basal body complex protein FliE
MVIRISPVPPIMVPNAVQSLQTPLSPLPESQIDPSAPASVAKEFGQYLAEALAKVESAQNDATSAAQKLALGEVSDVAEVMIASEKATLALNLTIQVRNKVLEAYQDMMRMPV